MVQPIAAHATNVRPPASHAVGNYGTIAERYQLIAPLAQGGQCTVYVAMDRQSGERVALKLVEPSDEHAIEQHQRLMREAYIGSRIASEHIVAVLDAGRDTRTGTSFLTMELLEGSDLQRLVEQSGPIAAGVALEYLRQIAHGLVQAHAWTNSQQVSTPIVHRDLKPANLYLTKRSDGSALIKILDFGIAKIVCRNATVSANIAGTPLYMAPAQLLGAAVSVATDVWALGLIAYFLVAGRSYWRCAQTGAPNLSRFFAEVASGAIEAPSRRFRELKLDIDLGPAFDAWFLRCVQRNPAKRYASVGDAVAELEQALGGASGSMTHDDNYQTKASALPRLARCIPRRLMWLCLGAVCGFAVVMGAACSFF